MTHATSDREGRRLRFASLTDVAALKELEDQSFTHDRLSARSIAHAVGSESQAVLVLETQQAEIAGAAILHYRRRSRRCRLYSLAVRRDFSGRGLGTRLLEACEKEAQRRGCEEIHLEVRTDRAATVRFYEARGFRQLGLKLRYYEDGGDAFSYAKAL
jgi:ribosomal protein S18 acetylase RimI-like enzyme